MNSIRTVKCENWRIIQSENKFQTKKKDLNRSIFNLKEICRRQSLELSIQSKPFSANVESLTCFVLWKVICDQAECRILRSFWDAVSIWFQIVIAFWDFREKKAVQKALMELWMFFEALNRLWFSLIENCQLCGFLELFSIKREVPTPELQVLSKAFLQTNRERKRQIKITKSKTVLEPVKVEWREMD